jgi:small-conductance mechanosensitive channel
MAENANSIPLWGWLCVLPLTWIIAGLLVGVARWLVLGRETAGTTPWLLVSALGGFTGMLAALAVAILIGGTAGLLLAPTLLVTSIGLLQWLLLQRQATPPPSWGLVSLVGGVIGWTECFIVFLLVADALAKLD